MSVELLLGLVGIIVAAGIGYLTGFKGRRFQNLEGGARSDLTLNVSVQTRVIACDDPDRAKKDSFVLETRIFAKNNARIPCCIPAVYVMARALVVRGIAEQYHGNFDFDNLPHCGSLSNVVDVARLPNTIIQLAPDEEEQFVRWETLDGEFVRRFPVVVVNVELFGASAELIGESHLPKLRVGPFRSDWIRYFGEAAKDGTRIMFARWPIGSQIVSDCVFPGRRYILSHTEPPTPDVDNTRRFRQVLDGVTQWSRHITVDLRTTN